MREDNRRMYQDIRSHIPLTLLAREPPILALDLDRRFSGRSSVWPMLP